MHFPKGLHLRLRWQCLSRLQFRAEGPDFQTELIPVHSPLLRESYLVSYPPLTYMLKFSGFADLASCLEVKRSESGRASLLLRKGKRWLEPSNALRSSLAHTCAPCVKLGPLLHGRSGVPILTHTTPSDPLPQGKRFAGRKRRH